MFVPIVIIGVIFATIDSSLAGSIIVAAFSALIGLLTWRVNKKKTDDDSDFNEVKRIREALSERDQLYRDLVGEIHILNAWVFLLTAQLRAQNIEPAEKPVSHD